MSDRKLLLITFDYELFLGDKSGSVRDCLILPTDRLIDILDMQGIKSYFFVDTVYLNRLKEVSNDHPSARRDLEEITTQLIRVVKSGHEIHPHIHSHWNDAIYDSENNDWSLKNKRYYSFASLPGELRNNFFGQSLDIIRSILERAGSVQAVDSYRAGGWTIQPFENFRPLFIQHGIKHEWSVMPGKYQISDAHSFDFRNAPSQYPVYRFDRDPCRIDEKGPFKEWTISSLTMNRYEKWLDFKISGLLHRMGKRPAFKGNTVSSVILEQGDSQSEGGHRRQMASFEGLNPFTIKKYISAIKKSGYFHFISHPKMLSKFEFLMVIKFLKKLNRKFEIKTDFRNS
jgi:hypothetical protein